MKNFTRILSSFSLVLVVAFSARSQEVLSPARLGIGTTTPQQKIEISGTTNTIRVDGLVTGSAHSVAPSANTANLIYVNNTSGDINGMALGASGSVMAIGAGGIPTWSSSAFTGNWNLTGGNNISTTYGINFLGTTNNTQLQFWGNSQALATAGVIDPINNDVYFGGGLTSPNVGWPGGVRTAIVTGATNNVAIGNGSLGAAASGTSYDVMIGYVAGFLYHATSANNGSTVVGDNALRYMTTVVPETSIGGNALAGNSAGGANNDAFGYFSQSGRTTGTKNVSIGGYSQTTGTTGTDNTSAGYRSMNSNSTNSFNTALGYYAGYQPVASYNSSIGYYALYGASVSRTVDVGAYLATPTLSTLGEDVLIGTNAARTLNSASVANGPVVTIGDSAEFSGGTVYKGVSIGYMADRVLTSSPTLGVALGYAAGYANSSGEWTTIIGAQTYTRATASQYSTFIGAGAANGTSMGSEGIAIGAGAQGSSSVTNPGIYDVVIGSTSSTIPNPITTSSALAGATLGSATAVYYTTAIGYNTANALVTGYYNNFIGYNAVSTFGGTSGTDYYNIAIGANTLMNPKYTNEFNIALGAGANAGYGSSATSNNIYLTAIGGNSVAGVTTATNTYSYYSTAIGANANASPPTSSTGTINSALAIGANSYSGAQDAIAVGANAYTNTAYTLILGSVNGTNGATSNVNVGLSTTTPAQALEIGGTSNTIRVDGLETTGTSFYQVPSNTAFMLYSLNSTGDIYSMPNGTTGQQLVLGANGAPTWGAPAISMTGTAPISNIGTVVPDFLLSGTTGAVLNGTGGGSAFGTAGAVDSILGVNSAGNVVFINANAVGGVNDLWGTQVAETDSSSLVGEKTITGNGTPTYPLRLAQQSATNNQILLWNTAAHTWKPGAINTSIVTKSIIGSSIVTIANGTNTVIGAANPSIDVRGTAGGVLTGQGSSSAIFSAAGTAGQVLVSNGSGSAPTWQALIVPLPWSLTGNSGIISGTDFLGTNDDNQLRFYNYGPGGSYAGPAGSLDPQYVGGTAFANVYMGAPNGNNSNTQGAGNNDKGSYNVGLGFGAIGFASATSAYNVGIGSHALEAINSGTMSSTYDVAIGSSAMINNSNGGNNNVGIGVQALGGVSGTSSNYNTAFGYQSMYGAQANGVYYGSYNAASGYLSLYNSTNVGAQSSTTAMGSNSAYQTGASTNSAVGDSALYNNTSGTANTAVGYYASPATGTLNNTTTIGANAQASASNTLILGQANGIGAGTVNTNVAIGTNTPATDAGLAIKKNHLESQGQLGSGNAYIDAGAQGSGGSPSASISSASNDMSGTISFTTGNTSLASGQMVTLTFGTAYTYSPIVSISAANSNGASAITNNGAYVSTSNSAVTIAFATAPAANTTYSFNYFIIETPGVLSSSIPCNVPITLTNSQSSATPTGFQEMLTVNSSAYASMEMPYLQNVEFSIGGAIGSGGTALQAWIESGASASSTSTVYWINMGTNTMAASGGTQTIYMNFMPTSVLSAAGPTGEAPQLPVSEGIGTYGQYDNGSLVFTNLYDNFAGTTINGRWVNTTDGYTTIVQNNGVTINSSNASATWGGLILNAGISNSPNLQVFDGDVTAVSGVAAGMALQLGNTNNSPSYDYNFWGGSMSWGTMDPPGMNSCGPCQTITTGIQGMIWISSTSETVFSNYVANNGNSGGSYTWQATQYPAIGIYYSSYNSNIVYQWVRSHYYAPNGVMPTASYGSTTCTGATQPPQPNPCDVAITLTNSTSTATSANFQQMITVNSSAYSAEELAGLTNVEFSTGPEGTGTLLNAWLESGNSTSSSNSIWWVNLGSNIIPAYGTLTIYMDFASSSIMSTAGPSGEAPQLSGTYAQYDDGGLVFPNVYTRWGGLSSGAVPTTVGTGAINGGGITIYGTPGSDITVTDNATNTQLTYLSTPSYAVGVAYTTTPASAGTFPTVLESDVSMTGEYEYYGTGNGYQEQGQGSYVCDDWGWSSTEFGVKSDNPTYQHLSTNATMTSSPVVWSLLLGSATTETCLYNYATAAGASGTALNSSPTYYGYFGTNQNGGTNQMNIYWTRTRQYPPNGTMPSASLGVISCCPTPSAANAVSGSSTFCPGSTGNVYTTTTVAGAAGYFWTVPTGSTITGGQGTLSITVTFGGTAGNVSVQVQNSCGALGTAASKAVTGTFAITAQPVSTGISCATGGIATFSVTTSGAVSGEQWQVSTNGGTSWSNVSNGGVYGGATTTSLTITNPPFSMAGYEYQCVVTGSCSGTITSSAATLSVDGNIPITLTNSQTTATPTNFAQMITVNSSLYTVQEMSGLQNVEFSIGGPIGAGGTALESWLESGNSNTATSTVYWVNLGTNTIAANGGTLTIYMNFMLSSVLAAAGPAGEAPQLSGTYAQYDNGTLVFPNFYNNFSGTTLAAKWTNDGLNTVAVNNGLTLNYSTSNWNAIYTNTFSSALNTVAETYVAASNTSGTGACINTTGNAGGNSINTSTNGVDAQISGAAGSGYAFGTGGSCTQAPSANTTLSSASPVSGTYYILSFYMLSTPIMQLNYGAFENVTGTGAAVGAISATSEVGLGVASGSTGSYQWFRDRPNAPNSVMPTVTIYSMTCCAVPPSLGSITSSTTTYCPGGTGTYSVTAVAGASSYLWTAPSGATITSGQGTTSINVTFGSASGNITVAAVNSCGEVGTASTQAVTSLFSITGPSNAAVSCVGGNASFIVTAVGATGYQWQVSTNGGTTWSNLSNVGIYSGVTTATLSLTGPTTAYSGYEYRCLVTSSSCSSATSSVGTLTVSGLYSVPITLTNSQTTATPTNFQQMLTLNFTGYGSASPALNAALNNVEFTTGPAGTGTPLYAWFENSSSTTPATAPSSSSTAAIVWVNLGSLTIPASGGTKTIYMTFMPSAVMTSTTSYTGEAPELTGTYGQYDNGALVFNSFYDNFAGSSLSSNWTSFASGTGTLTVSNELTINTPAQCSSCIAANVISSVNSYSPNLIADLYCVGSAPQSASRSYMPGLISNTATAEGTAITDYNASYGSAASSNSYLCLSNGRNALVDYSWLQGAPTTPSPYDDYNEYTVGSAEPWQVVSLVYSPTSNYMYLNYSLSATGNATYSPTTGTNMYYAIGSAGYNGMPGATSLSSYWARLRNYPPNNTMPTVSVGSYACY